MGASVGTEPDLRRLILDLSGPDWVQLKPIQSILRKSWSQALELHQKAITFSPGLARVVGVKLSALPPGDFSWFVETIWYFLQRRYLEGEIDRQELSPELRRIFDLPESLFPHTAHRLEDERESLAVQDDDRSDEPSRREAVDGGGDAIDVKSEPLRPTSGQLREWIQSLMQNQGAVLDGIERARSSVSEGAQIDDSVRQLLEAWNGLFMTGLPQVPQPFTLATIEVLLKAVEAQEIELSADRELIDRVLGLSFGDASAEALAIMAPLFERARTAEVPLTEALRRLLTSFYQVSINEAWDQSSDDLQLLTSEFGSRFQAVAAALIAKPSHIPSAFGAAPDAPPRSLPSPSSEQRAEQGPGAESAENGQPALGELATAMPTPEPVRASGEGMPEPRAEDDPTPPLEPAEDRVARIPSSRRNASDKDVDAELEHDSEPERAGESTKDDGPGELADSYMTGLRAALNRSDFALAYWYAQAGQDPLLTDACELLAISTSMGVESISTQQRARVLAAALGGRITKASPATLKAIAAAVTPAALVLPAYSEAAMALNEARQKLGADCPPFIAQVHELTYSRGAGITAIQTEPALASVEQAKASLDRFFHTEAAAKSTRFQRATEVWRELIRDHGALGSLMGRVLENPADAGVRPLLRKYSEHKEVGKLIERVDRDLHPLQASREGIIARANSELRELIDRAVSLMVGYLDACDRLTSLDGNAQRHLDLLGSIRQALRQEIPMKDVGDLLMAEVGRWLSGRLSNPEATIDSYNVETTLRQPLLLAWELTRASDGTLESDQVSEELLDSLASRTLEDAFSGFAAKDDQVGIAQLLEWIHVNAPSQQASFEDRAEEAEASSRERLRQRLEATRNAVAAALSASGLLSDATSQDMQDQLERVASDPNPHIPTAMATLQRILHSIDREKEARLQRARAALAELPHASADAVKRVEARLDEGDLVNAEEFIAQLKSGSADLPAEPALDKTFSEFWPAFSETAAGHSTDEDLWLSDLAASGTVAGRPFLQQTASELLRNGFDAWCALARDLRAGPVLDRVRAVMISLGFRLPINGGLERLTSPSRLVSHTIMRAPIEGFALVPKFGSLADRYVLVLCWDRKSPKGLLDAADLIAKGEPAIILYFHAMSPGDRRALAEASRKSSLPYIVVDHASMAFVGTRVDATVDTLMRISLPFSGINPFTPFVLGDVPREMFYGRNDELRQVQDPMGPLFVYGGRQLGKSALLKTAMKDFRTNPKRLSLFVDLKAQGIGEWREPDHIWSVLVEELRQLGVLDTKTSKSATGDVVVAKVKAWLVEDPERYLLALLDEADSFLDSDAKSAGAARFKNVYLLKSLMDATGRRFKPVFAGLHQVQRFHKESNGPMAHMGREIPIGPLPPTEAFKLVTRPLAAIGYEFSSPDAVWRLLNHTNYQASLIQLFCSALVERVRRSPVAKGQPPTRIDAGRVDGVYAEPEVRSSIAQRFEWTIQLDNRYRVIALTAAWLTLETPESTYPVNQLRDECRYFWSEGFSDASWEDFRSLLDEMVGLGVLVRAGDRYGIRSPNVIRLLGSQDEIYRKLGESHRLELAASYDPSRYRRTLRISGERSPLSEAQSARVLTADRLVDVIVGTQAVQADRVADALIELVGERRDAGQQVSLWVADADQLSASITAMSRESAGRKHLHWDARGVSADVVTDGLFKMLRQAEHGAISCSCLITPTQAVCLPDTPTRRTVLAPWQDADLRAIEPEVSFLLDRDNRDELLRLTGGWYPILKEVFAVANRHGSMKESAGRVVDAWCKSHAPADFLAMAEIMTGSLEYQLLQTVQELGGTVTGGDLIELVDADTDKLLSGLDALTLTGLLGEASTGEGLRVNPLVGWALG